MARKNDLGLPKPVIAEITRHGKRVFYFRIGGDKRIRLPNDHTSKEFRLAYEAAVAGKLAPREKTPREVRQSKKEVATHLRKQMIERRINEALDAAKTRARKKNWNFDLEWDWAREQLETHNFKCSVTGVPYYLEYDGTTNTNPYCPSIDRIDSKRGYTKDNCRLVVFAFNAMLMDWGMDVFDRVVNFYQATKREKRRAKIKEAQFSLVGELT